MGDTRKEIASFRNEYRFLSNFWQSKATLNGIEYPTAEHAYQAAKTLDTEIRLGIRSLETAGEAKAYGQTIQLRPDWDKIKIPIMKSILISKFITTDPIMMEKLLETGDAVLIEGNTWGDTFWGVCNGEGDNWLGILLMNIRAWGNNGLTGLCLGCRFGLGYWGGCATYKKLRDIGSLTGSELELTSCYEYEESTLSEKDEVELELSKAIHSKRDSLIKVKVITDVCINEEIITKGAIGYIRWGNTIFFPEGGVIDLPEKVDPRYVRYDYDDFWRGRLKLVK